MSSKRSSGSSQTHRGWTRVVQKISTHSLSLINRISISLTSQKTLMVHPWALAESADGQPADQPSAQAHVLQEHALFRRRQGHEPNARGLRIPSNHGKGLSTHLAQSSAHLHAHDVQGTNLNIRIPSCWFKLAFQPLQHGIPRCQLQAGPATCGCIEDLEAKDLEKEA